MAQAVPKEKIFNSLSFLSFSSHKLPVIKEAARGKDWFDFGEKNDYPYYLLKLFNRSAKHNAIVNGKANYIFGNGWEVVEGDKSLDAFLLKANADEDFATVSRKCILDLEIFGGFVLEVIWGKGGGLSEINHVDFSHIRSNEDNTEFYFTKKWIKDSGYRNTNPDLEEDWEVYPYFNPAKKTGKQLLYFKLYRPGINVYPLPEYLGATAYIEMDYLIADYWYSALKNGFAASHIINFFNGVPTTEEKKKIEDMIREKFTGVDSVVKFILGFYNSKDNGSEIIPIPHEDLDKQFQILNTTVEQEVYSGHRITSPMLFGIKSAGQLGGRTELIEANELFMNIYVKPKQKIIENVFNDLLIMGGIKGKMKLTNSLPIDFMFSESTIIQFLPAPVISKMISDKMGIKTENQEQKMAKKLISIGKKKDNYFIVRKREIEFTDLKDLKSSEGKFMGFAKVEDITLKSVERSVLDLLSKDNLMPASEMATALNISEKEIVKAIKHLQKLELLKSGKEISGDEKVKSLIPIADALKILEKRPAKTEMIRVMYSYEWRAGFSDKDYDTSREFCKELMDADLLYEREDIEKLENDFGTSVWNTRGGWYTKPGTETHLPFCRHVWNQNLINEI